MLSNLLAECIKEGREKQAEFFCLLWDSLGQNGIDTVDQIIASTIQKTLEKCINLADDIEVTTVPSTGNGGQWRAFKSFRNHLSDQLTNLNKD